MLDRQLPKDTDTEFKLLAGCILDPLQIDGLTLDRRHFFDDMNGKIWNLIQDMRASGDPVDDVQALKMRMQARGIWEQAQGMTWLSRAFHDGVTHRFHVAFYAKTLIRLANCRRMIEIGETIVRQAYEEGADPEPIAAAAQSAIAARLEITDDVFRLDELARGMIDEIDSPTKQRHPLFTGWGAFDEYFGPLLAGETTIIGARSSIGKTAAMLQMCIHNARRGRAVLFASLEMPVKAVRDRIMCALAAVDSVRFRSNNLSPEEKELIRKAGAVVDGWPLFIWSPRGRKTITRIAAKARSMKAEHDIRLLCVDYLQKIHHDGPKCNREEEVAGFARGVKDIAMDLDIPVVTGSQLSRKADSDDREIEPSLHHLRESGAIEQEADVVVFVHRRDRLATRGKFICAKFRNGTPGELEAEWNPLLQEFTLLSPSDAKREREFDLYNEG